MLAGSDWPPGAVGWLVVVVWIVVCSEPVNATAVAGTAAVAAITTRPANVFFILRILVAPC